MEYFMQILLEKSVLWVPRASGLAVVLLVFMVLARVAKGIINGISERLQLDEHLSSLFARTARVTLIIFGFVTALGTLGINISALVAGLGLTGFALGFALKDTISNLLSGILILLYRPFEIGDRIKNSGFEGVVVSIDMRYTRLVAEGCETLIPNSKLFTNPVTVLQKRDEAANMNLA